MNIPTYAQPIKNRVRQKILSHAVRALTTDREHSSIIRPDEFSETLDYALAFMRKLGLNGHLSAEVKSFAKEWLTFLGTTTRQKTPQELRVLYLCGPEPQNDLEVLTGLGVLPQHVWAIESERDLYRKAIAQLKQQESFIRVHHGGLETFLDMNNDIFDIIYIDACGPLPGGDPNTLRAPINIFYRERLAPLGALITNFAHPGAENIERYEQILRYYFAPRNEDVPRALNEEGEEIVACGLSPDQLEDFISAHFQESYSEFITRFLVDLGRGIIPYARIYSNPDVRKKYFAKDKTLAQVERKATNLPPIPMDEEPPEAYMERFYRSTGDAVLNSHGYPILAFIMNLSENKDLDQLVQRLVKQPIGNGAIKSLKEPFVRATLLAELVQGHVEAASPEMMAALTQSWFDRRLVRNGAFFCDIPMPHLLINSLFGIYGHPYFGNPRASLRLSYVAKETRMYTDVLLMDQCRYYFDYLPTIDLFPRRFESWAYQLILRTCLDRIGRHDFTSSSHPFRGAALAGFGDISSDGPFDFDPRVDENKEGAANNGRSDEDQ
jgi:hypothetical protein